MVAFNTKKARGGWIATMSKADIGATPGSILSEDKSFSVEIEQRKDEITHKRGKGKKRPGVGQYLKDNFHAPCPKQAKFKTT